MQTCSSLLLDAGKECLANGKFTRVIPLVQAELVGDPGVADLVLGVGNSILKDEGFGVHVVTQLEERREELGIPPEVDIIDGATLGLDLLYYIEGREKVIMIDIVNAGEKPGTIFRFNSDDIKTKVTVNKVSMHQVTLFDVLTMAQVSGRMPNEAIIIGVQPGEIDWGLELSPEVEAQVPRVIELVLKEINIA